MNDKTSINYFVLHDYAKKNKVRYGDLCAMVVAAIEEPVAQAAIAEPQSSAMTAFHPVNAKEELLSFAAYFRRIGDLWEGPDGCGTPGTDLCEQIARAAYSLAHTPMALGLDMVPSFSSKPRQASPVKMPPIEAVSDAVHAAWMVNKRSQKMRDAGFTRRKTGKTAGGLWPDPEDDDESHETAVAMATDTTSLRAKIGALPSYQPSSFSHHYVQRTEVLAIIDSLASSNETACIDDAGGLYAAYLHGRYDKRDAALAARSPAPTADAGLRDACAKALDTLTDPQIGTWSYMESSQMYDDFRDAANALREALVVQQAQTKETK